MKYEEEFIEWLYANKKIYNGDMLISYLEDGESYYQFLMETGLEDD